MDCNLRDDLHRLVLRCKQDEQGFQFHAGCLPEELLVHGVPCNYCDSLVHHPLAPHHYLVCYLGSRAKPDLPVGYLVNFDLCHSATVILTYSVRITMTRRFDFDKHTVFNKIIYTP